MSEIVFTRVDFRLIHGQVITKWIRLCEATQIVIIDDALPGDAFMAQIYTMAAPPGYKVHMLTVADAAAKWADGSFPEGKIFLMMRDIATLGAVVEQGVPIKDVQLGGIEFKPGRVKVYGTMSLDDADAHTLKGLVDKGVNIYFQSTPEDAKETAQAVLAKHFNL